jgi:glycosyltransferase involved in cell wall biosynthesis
MRVLIYYPSSDVSVFILSAIDDLISKNHTVYLLTTTPVGNLHKAAEKLGAKTFTLPGRNIISGLLKDAGRLIMFCKKHKIDFVFSHLQYLNLVVGLSRLFIKAAVFPTRHHADDVYLSGNKNAMRLDKLVNTFAKKILVVAPVCKRQMTANENVPDEKIIILPLFYNFSFYNQPADDTNNNPGSTEVNLKLINISRMVENKNHMALLLVTKKLIAEGFNIALTLLDTGPLELQLKNFVNDAGLNKQVVFLGRQAHVLEHISNADLLVHTSVSEASCQVTKEAGICKKPVIVVKGVGDFDEYVFDGKTGFYLSNDDIQNDLYRTLKNIYANKAMLAEMGESLEKSVKAKFDIAAVKNTYANIVDGSIK